MRKERNILTELDDINKWNFDKVYLAELIDKGKKRLLSDNLSRRMKQYIKIDIETFGRFIKEDFELQSSPSYKVSLPNDIDKLKEYILARMSKQYKMLGENIIRWIIDLSEARIFEEDNTSSWDLTELPLEAQIELIIKNYEKNSSKFLEPAKKIVIDQSVRQIQVVDRCDSYCHHDNIANNSFLIIDSSEAPCIFNHEVQHTIETMLKYKTNPVYSELGAIYYEMLFNEELYKLNGYLETGDFDFRLDDVAFFLKSLNDYFKILLLFAEKDFNIPTDNFLYTFQTVKKIKPRLLTSYLREEIATDETLEDMTYLFSILKAIELREISMSSSTKQPEILEAYLKRKRFQFQIPKDGFKVYERYINEMNQKVRKRSK